MPTNRIRIHEDRANKERWKSLHSRRGVGVPHFPTTFTQTAYAYEDSEVWKMSKMLSIKTGFLDLAAALFVIGGIISLIINVLTINSVYPFTMPENFSYALAVLLLVSLICSLGAIHSYNLMNKRLLSQAGIRGIVFGAILLALNLGLAGVYHTLNAQLGAASAIIVLVGGAICFVLRETMPTYSPFVQMIPQGARQR